MKSDINFEIGSIRQNNKNDYSKMEVIDLTKKDVFIDFKKGKLFEWIDFKNI